MRAVAGLPPQQRAAVALYYLEDRPVDEVAHLLEVAPGHRSPAPVPRSQAALRRARREPRGGDRRCRSMTASARVSPSCSRSWVRTSSRVSPSPSSVSTGAAGCAGAGTPSRWLRRRGRRRRGRRPRRRRAEVARAGRPADGPGAGPGLGGGLPGRPAPLEAATYAIGFLGASDAAPWAEIEVPDGWSHDRLHPATGPDLDPHLRRIELLTVAIVAPDPCRTSASPSGPGVADLMAALAAQRTVRPGRPRPVTIDGYAGQLVQVRVPVDVDLAALRTRRQPGAVHDAERLPRHRLPRLDLPGVGARRRGRATGHPRRPRPRGHARRTGRAHPDDRDPRVRPASLDASQASPPPLEPGPGSLRGASHHERNHHVRTSDSLPASWRRSSTASWPPALRTPYRRVPRPTRLAPGPGAGSSTRSSAPPTSPHRWILAATPSRSSAPPTTPRGRRSRCRTAGATTGSTRPPARTSTPTCAASSCSPSTSVAADPCRSVRRPGRARGGRPDDGTRGTTDVRPERPRPVAIDGYDGPADPGARPGRASTSALPARRRPGPVHQSRAGPTPRCSPAGPTASGPSTSTASAWS